MSRPGTNFVSVEETLAHKIASGGLYPDEELSRRSVKFNRIYELTYAAVNAATATVPRGIAAENATDDRSVKKASR